MTPRSLVESSLLIVGVVIVATSVPRAVVATALLSAGWGLVSTQQTDIITAGAVAYPLANAMAGAGLVYYRRRLSALASNREVLPSAPQAVDWEATLLATLGLYFLLTALLDLLWIAPSAIAGEAPVLQAALATFLKLIFGVLFVLVPRGVLAAISRFSPESDRE